VRSLIAASISHPPLPLAGKRDANVEGAEMTDDCFFPCRPREPARSGRDEPRKAAGKDGNAFASGIPVADAEYAEF
jgi:hypothetical protein